MKIAILAWGSLTWNPDRLPLNSAWECNGPRLPIEFSRVSKDARLTLVIDPDNGVEVPTRIALSKRPSLLDAVADLRDRECTVIKHIGFTDRGGEKASYREHAAHEATHQSVTQWLVGTSFDAAIWTALPSNYREQLNHSFTLEHATKYLQTLPLGGRDNALEYIRKAPVEVVTPLREYLKANGLS